MRAVAVVLLVAGCSPFVDRSLDAGETAAPLPSIPFAAPLAARLDVAVARTDGGIDALVVMRNGRLAHAVGPVDRPVNVASVRKSVLSLLFGIAADKGLVDLGGTLAEMDTDEPTTPLTRAEASATIRDLLAGRSGIYLPADAEGDRDRPPRGRDAPGTAFHYGNWGFNALGLIFERETGLAIGDALNLWLARPIGLQDFHPSHVFMDEDGGPSAIPAYRMFLSARDLARIGALVAAEGRWGDEQVVPASWITASAEPLSEVGPPLSAPPVDAYGLSWWIDPSRGDMIASGWGGQILYVGRSDGWVVAMVNDTGNTPLEHALFRLFGERAGGRDMEALVRILRDG